MSVSGIIFNAAIAALTAPEKRKAIHGLNDHHSEEVIDEHYIYRASSNFP